MTVILVLLMFAVFLTVDHFMKPATKKVYCVRGTTVTTPGFEMLGALAQDGGEPVTTVKEEDTETNVVLEKMRRTNAAAAQK